MSSHILKLGLIIVMVSFITGCGFKGKIDDYQRLRNTNKKLVMYNLKLRNQVAKLQQEIKQLQNELDEVSKAYADVYKRPS